MSKLEEKICVITGATSGMALATAKLFVHEGAHVYITGRRQEQLEQAVHEIEASTRGVVGGVTAVRADSGNLADLDRLFETVTANHGRIDVLYVAAGITGIDSHTEPLAAVTTESFDRVFAVNVRGTLFTVQKALPLMTRGASIILNGSAGAAKGISGSTVYTASKAALRSFVRTWTAELKDLNIRVNLVSPGPIDTASFDGFPAEVREYVTSLIPAGRFGRPEEIATAALFLASTDSSFIYGSDLFVDGGLAQV